MTVEAAARRDARTLGEPALEALRTTILSHFARDRYHRVGIRDICAEARVSPKTVYKYFGNKEELLLACIEPDMAELARRASDAHDAAADPLAALRAFADVQLRFYAENPAVARIVFLNIPMSYWLEHHSPAQSEFQALLERTLRVALGPLSAPQLQMVRDAASGAVHRVIVRWLAEGEPDDLLTRTAPLTTWLAHGLAAIASAG